MKIEQWIINAVNELEGELANGDIGHAPWLESEQHEVRAIIARHAPATPSAEAVTELQELANKMSFDDDRLVRVVSINRLKELVARLARERGAKE